MKLFPSMTVVLVALAACTPKDKNEATPAASGAAAPTPTLTASATPVTDAAASVISAANDPLPARNNLAREARRDINAKNYKTELDKIEKDLDAP